MTASGQYRTESALGKWVMDWKTVVPLAENKWPVALSPCACVAP